MTNKQRKVGASINPGLISLKHTPTVDLKFTGPIETLHAPKLFDTDDGLGEVYPVLNLDTGEVAHLMAYAVIKSSLEKLEGGYVGKSFRIESAVMADGDKYRRIKIFPILEE